MPSLAVATVSAGLDDSDSQGGGRSTDPTRTAGGAGPAVPTVPAGGGSRGEGGRDCRKSTRPTGATDAAVGGAAVAATAAVDVSESVRDGLPTDATGST